MRAATKFTFLVSFLLLAALVAILFGAKYHYNVKSVYRATMTNLGIKSYPNDAGIRSKRQQIQLKQPYKDKSVLDLPSKLHPKDHQDYLTGLKEKYKDKLPIPKMVKIKGGTFEMGCHNEPCSRIQLPVHEVTIKPFLMAETEVTFEQWDTCVAMGGCYTMPGDLGFGRGQRPVLAVSWDDATSQFIRWLNENTEGGFRLPTEAEWEYAARAGTTTKRYWGNQDPSCDLDSPYGASWGAQPWWKREKTCPNPGTSIPVASFPPNPWGLYDMLGSVHEWTQDCENGKDYTGAPTDGSAWEDKVCSRRVTRGGAWTSHISNMSVANRKVYEKSGGLERVGFRIVRDIQK